MRLVALALAVMVVLGGCRGAGAGEDELVVSAAASLADAFAAIADGFEQATPGVDVVLNLGGSSALREQILEGAPVDVFASANPATMDDVVAAGLVLGQPQTLARNRLVIAVPARNPGGVSGLEDFDEEHLLIGLCADGVPCGDLARETLSSAGVTPSVDSNEPDVRALITKIAEGELDAGITYATDVVSHSEAVAGIAIPEGHDVVAEYRIAALARSANADAAAAFIAFVLSASGRETMAEFGFDPP